jgi:antitoxin HicB
MSKKQMGSSLDDFLKEEGIFAEAQAQAVKEVVAWQLAEAMKKKKISKNRMATLLKTSRTQVDRLLNAKDDITLSSLFRAIPCAPASTVFDGSDTWSLNQPQHLDSPAWLDLFLRLNASAQSAVAKGET